MVHPKAASRPTVALACFLLLAYGLDWIIQIPAALANRGLIHVRVPHMLQVIAQVAPAIAALVTVGSLQGSGAVKTLLGSVARVRLPFLWYASVLLAPIASQAAAVLVYQVLGHPIPAFDSFYEVPLLIALIWPLCQGEEIGWRGFLLKNLMRSNSPLAATGSVAFWWGLWHLPLYLGHGQGVVFLVSSLGMFPLSAFFTFIYLPTDSVFLCALFYTSIDVGANYWFSPLPDRDFLLGFGLWIAGVWLVAIPVFVALAKSTPAQVSGLRDHFKP